jgi:hypothetical protein
LNWFEQTGYAVVDEWIDLGFVVESVIVNFAVECGKETVQIQIHYLIFPVVGVVVDVVATVVDVEVAVVAVVVNYCY